MGDNNSLDWDQFDKDRPPSKSQRKRDMHELQKLSAALATLKIEILTGLNLPENLIDSITQAAKLKSSNARNRQLRHAAKILEDQQQLLEPIQQYFDAQANQAHRQAQHHRLVEHWRDRLVDPDEDALSDFFQSFPNTDRQQLTTLVRHARKEKKSAAAPIQQRKLFKYLRDQAR